MTNPNHTPLVSVGIPTYNRAESLKKTITSVINQTYSNLEIIISDNASTDSTQQVCEEFCQLDPRITYIRQPKNFGAGNNFRFVLEKAQGEYFMWLGDDDWIDDNYIAQCLNFISKNISYGLVAGTPKYYVNHVYTHSDIDITLDQKNPTHRLLDYYKRVRENGVFYGIYRLSFLSKVPIEPSLGGDWHMIAALAFMGKVKTLPDIYLHRSSTWSHDYFLNLTKSLGLPDWHSRYPYISIALSASQSIIKFNKVYITINQFQRFYLAIIIFFVIVNSRYIVRLKLMFISFFKKKCPSKIYQVLKKINVFIHVI